MVRQVQALTLNQRFDELTKRMTEMAEAQHNLTKSVDALQKTWDQASGAIHLIKWVAIVAAAIVATMTATLKFLAPTGKI